MLAGYIWLAAYIINVSVCLHREYLRIVDVLFDWFGLVCFANKNKNCQFSYS
jgi:hypothetical protein